MNLFVGKANFGRYVLMIATPHFWKNSTYSPDEELNLPYYEVLLSKKDTIGGVNIFYPVYLNKEKLLHIDFSRPDRSSPDYDQEEEKSYLHRKDMQEPLWKLNRNSVVKLIEKVKKLSEENTKE